MGRTLLQLARAYEAVAVYAQALQLDPDDVATALELGKVLSDLSHYSEALLVYERILRQAPHTAEAHVGKGYILWMLKRYKEALVAYDCAVQFDPRYVPLLQWRESLPLPEKAPEQGLRVCEEYPFA